MFLSPGNDRIFALFATLLDYPWSPVAEAAAECATLTAPRSPEAAAFLSEFAAFARRTPLSRLEEIYTGVFELDATCHPYVGYHLFGESYKRSAFLVGLKECYRPYQIDYGSELPDHLAVILRFLAVCRDEAELEDMIREALHPTVRKMLKEKDEEPPDPSIPKPPSRGEEYRRVLQALRLVLLTITPDDALSLGTVTVDELPMAVPEF